MNRSKAFTLVELLVVIAIIGILVALLLPAVQAAREAARRAACSNNLVQLVMAVNNYESAHRVYPPGTIDAQGPILNLPRGYHHSWLTHLLPYIEQKNTYRHIDRTVGVYHKNNKPVRDLNISILRCPSSVSWDGGYTEYAAAHHDLEAPIDLDNSGVFFLNSKVRYLDVSDGASHTFFLGEKLPLADDLGWMAGTRSTLRNTGTRMNELLASGRRTNRWVPVPVSESHGFGSVNTDGDDDTGMTTDAAAKSEDDPTTADARPEAAAADQRPAIVDGVPTTPAGVGGFESQHPGGANFAFGDGRVSFITETINLQIYQQLGHRADGKLLDGGAF